MKIERIPFSLSENLFLKSYRQSTTKLCKVLDRIIYDVSPHFDEEIEAITVGSEALRGNIKSEANDARLLHANVKRRIADLAKVKKRCKLLETILKLSEVTKFGAGLQTQLREIVRKLNTYNAEDLTKKLAVIEKLYRKFMMQKSK